LKNGVVVVTDTGAEKVSYGHWLLRLWLLGLELEDKAGYDDTFKHK
jgi:hypothetical protein